MMPDPVHLYVHDVYKQFAYYANWLPNAARKLGDVGVVKNHCFQRESSLLDKSIPFKDRVGTTLKEFTHTSQSGVSLDFTLTPLQKTGVTVRFSSAGGFVFQAGDTAQEEIEDQHALARQLLQMLRAGTWQEDWCVVTQIVAAGSLTVLVAESDDASLELAADGAALSESIPLASLSASLKVTKKTGIVTTVIAANPTSPLFTLSRFRKSFLDRVLKRDPDFGRAIAANEEPFETVAG